LKSTEPVGVPEPGDKAVTVAVKVTESPKHEGVRGERAVEVPAWFTVWETAGEMLVL